MALPPTAGCCFFSNSAYVKIFHNDELKYSYFDWKNEDLSDEMKKKNDCLKRWTCEQGVMLAI